MRFRLCVWKKGGGWVSEDGFFLFHFLAFLKKINENKKEN